MSNTDGMTHDEIMALPPHQRPDDMASNMEADADIFMKREGDIGVIARRVLASEATGDAWKKELDVAEAEVRAIPGVEQSEIQAFFDQLIAATDEAEADLDGDLGAEVAPERMKISSVPRNDIPSALRFATQAMDARAYGPDEAEMLFMLQDEGAAWIRAVNALVAERTESGKPVPAPPPEDEEPAAAIWARMVARRTD